MNSSELKSKFTEAITDGLCKMEVFGNKFDEVSKIICDASEAINSVYKDTYIRQKKIVCGDVKAIMIFLSVSDDLFSQKLMEIDFPKGESFNFIVKLKDGVHEFEDSDALVGLFQSIFASPMFWSELHSMRGSI